MRTSLRAIAKTARLRCHAEASATEEPGARKRCAVGRDVQSLMQSGGIRKEILGSSNLPDGESLGNNSMLEKREILEGVYSIVLQDSHDMAKTTLCES